MKFRMRTIIIIIINLVFVLSCNKVYSQELTEFQLEILKMMGKANNPDTTIEKTFFDNGNLQRKSQKINGILNGKTLIYHYHTGTIKHEEYYKDGNLDGVSKYFHENGTLGVIQYFDEMRNFGVSVFFANTGDTTKTVKYLDYCELGSPDCNKIITIYSEGKATYSFEMKNGWKSDMHNIINQTLYKKLEKEKKEHQFLIIIALCVTE